MKILIMGATGMLGSAMMNELTKDPNLQVWGTLRNDDDKKFFSPELRPYLISGISAFNYKDLESTLEKIKPDIIINCIGLVKQDHEIKNPISAISINALLPHQLAFLAKQSSARFIQISTDCVFSGKKGNYSERDFSDAEDLYGRSKYLGEMDLSNTLTLRTSIIGHELKGRQSLLEWFLSQEKVCEGFDRAIFSGLTTTELSRMVHGTILPNKVISGVFNISSAPISKFQLLKKIAKVYKKEIEIIPNDRLVIDRSLSSKKFFNATGYLAPDWDAMLQEMHQSYFMDKKVGAHHFE